jgi:hypothetical protein
MKTINVEVLHNGIVDVLNENGIDGTLDVLALSSVLNEMMFRKEHSGRPLGWNLDKIKDNIDVGTVVDYLINVLDGADIGANDSLYALTYIVYEAMRKIRPRGIYRTNIDFDEVYEYHIPVNGEPQVKYVLSLKDWLKDWEIQDLRRMRPAQRASWLDLIRISLTDDLVAEKIDCVRRYEEAIRNLENSTDPDEKKRDIEGRLRKIIQNIKNSPDFNANILKYRESRARDAIYDMAMDMAREMIQGQ